MLRNPTPAHADTIIPANSPRIQVQGVGHMYCYPQYIDAETEAQRVICVPVHRW